MTQSRNELIELVKEDWQDQKVKETCLRESKKKISIGQENRAFDEFPRLVNSQKLNRLIADIKTISELSEKIQYKNLKNLMKQLQKLIAAFGSEALFTSKGKIKQKILDLFEWREFEGNINPLSLLCGFVGAVNQQLFANPRVVEALNKNSTCRFLVSDLNTNNQYRNWTKETMIELKLMPPDPFDPAAAFAEFTRENPGTTLGVGLGSAALLSLGIGLFVAAVTKGGESAEVPDLTKKFKF